MKKTIKIEFEGQSKAVVASTKVEYELENEQDIIIFNDDFILKEAVELYNKANKHADVLTKSKFF